MGHFPVCFKFDSGRKSGKAMTSLMEGLSVNNITNLSIPIPRPPVGGLQEH